MFQHIFNNITNTLNNIKSTIHIHNHTINENIDNGEIHIIGCKTCPQLWELNNRLQWKIPLEMDWEIAEQLVNFHPDSKFAALYSGNIPKWWTNQNHVYPEFIPIA